MVSKSLILDVVLEALEEYEVDDSEELAFHITEQLSDVVDMAEDIDDDSGEHFEIDEG